MMREDVVFMADLPKWRHRRYGLFLHANLACVPAWAPIGRDARRYLEDLKDPDLSVEVAAHHQSRWSHVREPSEFLSLLHFAMFSPQQWVDLARDAGMSHLVQVAKDTDGLCWWDAPDSDFTVVAAGPSRNVCQEIATACSQAGLGYGTAFATDVSHLAQSHLAQHQVAQITDLVERIGSRYLVGITEAEHTDNESREAITACVSDLRAQHPDLIVDDTWGVRNPDRATQLSAPPTDICDTPWELVRGLGAGWGHNRVETAQHRLTPSQIVALLTEVLAKGGNLMFAVGVGAEGRLLEHHGVALRAAGAWITAHADLVHRSTPWKIWGDDQVRYLRTGLSDQRGECLWAVDLTGRGEFAALSSVVGEITDITDEIGTAVQAWAQTSEGLRIERPVGLATRRNLQRDIDPSSIAVYRVWLRSAEDQKAEHLEHGLFDPELFAAPNIDLTALLGAAVPGTVVQLGEAVYAGGGEIPPGVTIRGLGPHRTRILVDPARPLHVGSSTRIEFLGIEPDLLSPQTPDRSGQSLITLSGDSAVLLGVRVDGSVHVFGEDHLLRSCDLKTVRGREIGHLTVSRCHFAASRPDAHIGIELLGGSQHLIEGCEIIGYRTAIACGATEHLRIRGNAIASGLWGMRITNSQAPHLVGNTVKAASRAIDIDGGSGAVIDANAVSDGDSGCLVRNGATSVIVSGNHWQHCRIGLMIWGAGEVVHHSNIVAGLLEPEHAVMTGPT